MFQVAAFYRFVELDDIANLCTQLRDAGAAVDACGTILIAPEGINATIAGPMGDAFRDYVAMIAKDYGLDPATIKWSTASDKPFGKFKVRAKREIITMKRPEANPTVQTGVHVDAADWNDLIAQPDVLLLDTRNDYETAVGIFEGAVDPVIKTFTQFAEYVDRNLDPAKTPKIAMFCTGGIRCEKASSYMLARGFREVYQLNGGILKYLETVPDSQSKWQGDCFVFDKRIALGQDLAETSYEWCDQCHAMAKPVGAVCTCTEQRQTA